MKKRFIINTFIIAVIAVWIAAVITVFAFNNRHTFSLSGGSHTDSLFKSEEIQPVFGRVKIWGTESTDIIFTDTEDPGTVIQIKYANPGKSQTVKLNPGRWYTVQGAGNITVRAVNVRISQSDNANTKENEKMSESEVLLYQGHGSLRITEAGGKVIYIDPYAGTGYDKAADLILITHGHSDHTATDKIKSRNPGCREITWKEALEGGKHRTFDLGYVTVEAVEAGYNRNHSVKECVGYILTFTDGLTVYISGDTSKTEQMASLSERKIDYAFFCCDGIYNMDVEEASECAQLVGAAHSIPYHMAPGKLFDRSVAEKFSAPGRLIIADGEETELPG